VIRVGHGFDAHRLAEGRPFILGGVHGPHDRGPRGHSDADVLLHAISDALLGACALGDLGGHFPDSDPQWKGADSLRLLAAVHELIARHGFTLGNIDATVVVDRPKLAAHVGDMRERIAATLAVDAKAKALKREIVLPVDAVVAQKLAAHVPTRVVAVEDVGATDMILDIGPRSVEHVISVLARSKTLVWNGPLGAFETPPFDAGTVSLALLTHARLYALLTRAGVRDGPVWVSADPPTRTELYLAAENGDEAEARPEVALLALAAELGPALYRLRDGAAALHLFRLAAGLDPPDPREV